MEALGENSAQSKLVRGCISEGMQSMDKQEKASILVLKVVTVNPVALFIEMDGNVVKNLFDTGTDYCFISYLVYNKYFRFKKRKY